MQSPFLIKGQPRGIPSVGIMQIYLNSISDKNEHSDLEINRFSFYYVYTKAYIIFHVVWPLGWDKSANIYTDSLVYFEGTNVVKLER